MSEERFFQLVSRKLANEATQEELQELDSALLINKYFRELYEQLLPAAEKQTEIEADEADASFALHAMKMQLRKEDENSLTPLQDESHQVARGRMRSVRWVFSIAALFVLLFITVLYLQKEKHVMPPADGNEVVSRKGSKSTVKLPDGTKVWLNADSKLTYGDFSGKIREVTLTGEAFFDVAKDSTRPFLIHADKINIRVLGTAFNVKSYPQDETIETSLIHGKIELTYTERPSEKFILHPNEKLTIKKNQGVGGVGQTSPKIQLNNIIVSKDSIVPETAWIENKFSFSNETLDNIARSLERQFDVRITFTDEEPKQYSYTGLFEHEDVDKILRVLSLSQPFRYQRVGSTITIGK